MLDLIKPKFCGFCGHKLLVPSIQCNCPDVIENASRIRRDREKRGIFPTGRVIVPESFRMLMRYNIMGTTPTKTTP